MPTKFIPANLVSKDWQTLADFYTNVFDCKTILPERNLSGDWLEEETGVRDAKIRGFHLLLPGFGENSPTLEIFQYNESEPRALHPKANREGLGHIAFHVDNVENTFEKLIKFGGHALGEIVTKDFRNGSITFIYATDPEGNIVEIQKWKNI